MKKKKNQKKQKVKIHEIFKYSGFIGSKSNTVMGGVQCGGGPILTYDRWIKFEVYSNVESILNSIVQPISAQNASCALFKY